MRFDDIAAEDPISSNAAVVRALRSREAVLGPAIRPVVGTEEGILLLETEPGLVLGVGLHQPRGLVAVVKFIGAAIPVPGFAHHKDVVAAAEGIGVHGAGAEIDIGVFACSLAGGRSVEIPFRELVNALDGLVECLCDGTDYY